VFFCLGFGCRICVERDVGGRAMPTKFARSEGPADWTAPEGEEDGDSEQKKGRHVRRMGGGGL